MTVKERIITLSLIEKIKAKPEYAEQIGLEIIRKKNDEQQDG